MAAIRASTSFSCTVALCCLILALSGMMQLAVLQQDDHHRAHPMGRLVEAGHDATTTVFVTAWIDLGANYTVRSSEERLNEFCKLASSGIPLIVFASSCYIPRLEPLRTSHPNILRIIPMELKDLHMNKIVTTFPKLKLPPVISETKDTQDYMTLQLAKIEFLHIALLWTGASHLAWIDFNIAHVFRSEAWMSYLRNLEVEHLKQPLLAFPGMWKQGIDTEMIWLLYRANWRFAGGFFVADRTSIESFYALSCDALKLFLAHTRTIVWEINFWAWLEETYTHCFRPIVYPADHDESLILLPREAFHDVSGT